MNQRREGVLLVWGCASKYLAAIAVLAGAAVMPFMHVGPVAPDWGLAWADGQSALINTGATNLSGATSEDRVSELLKKVKLFCNDAFTRTDGSRDNYFILVLVANVSGLLMGVLFFCWGGVKNLLGGFWKRTASVKDKVIWTRSRISRRRGTDMQLQMRKGGPRN